MRRVLYRYARAATHLSVVVPVDEGVGGRTRLNGAGEVDGAAGLDEQLVVANDGRLGF